MQAIQIPSLFHKINFSWFYIFLGLCIYFFTKELNAIGDFEIFFAAAEDIKKGVNIYQNFYGNGFKYLYSPLFVVILSWFTPLGLTFCGIFWKCINLIVFLRLYSLLKEYLPDSLSNKNLNRIFLATFALSLALIYQNLHNLQFNLFMLWIVFESFRLFETKYYTFGAFLLGFICSVKIIPITLVFYLVYRGKFLIAGLSSISIIFYIFLPSIFIGFNYNFELLTSWFELINPQNREHNFDLSEKGLTSLTSILPAFFADTSYTDPNFTFRRHIVDLSPSTVFLLVQLARISIVSLSFAFIGFKVFKKPESKMRQLLEISYILLATVLMAPHQQNYAFVFVLPAMVYLSWMVLNLKQQGLKKQFLFLIICLIICGLLLNLEFYLGNFRKLYSYLKFAGLGALLLIIPLYIFRKNIPIE